LSRRDALRGRIDQTPFVDTHEHLVEESTRLLGAGAHRLQPCVDAALLFTHYAKDDLWVAGMGADARDRFFSPSVDPADKWSLLAPAYERVRTTGYIRAVDETLARLFAVDRLDKASFVRVSEQMVQRARPGFYRDVIAAAGVEVCQVNSLETFFCETADPEVLQQDLSLVPFTTGIDQPTIERFAERSGVRVKDLGDWHTVIDWAFATYGPRADAVKSQAAYQRRLDYAEVSADDAAPQFERLLGGKELSARRRKALEDHLMRYCLAAADRARLPVKLHCGYYAGSDRMPLERARQNAADLCPLLIDFPDVSFVLMHIGYPYQDEYIALAKHYRNVTIDLCWAWIINPVACVRFIKEFLAAAPRNKILTFGGDYGVVEPVVGHAAIARQGLAQALDEMVEDGWLAEAQAFDLVDPLIRGNARDLFPIFGRA